MTDWWGKPKPPRLKFDDGFWSSDPCLGANYMMLRYAMYPKQDIEDERYLEMKQFCAATFGWDWVSSKYSHAFAFRKESDMIIFKMAFPDG